MSATIPDPERSDIPSPPTLLFIGSEPAGEPVPQARVPGYEDKPGGSLCFRKR